MRIYTVYITKLAKNYRLKTFCQHPIMAGSNNGKVDKVCHANNFIKAVWLIAKE